MMITEATSQNKRYWSLLWRALKLNEDYQEWLSSNAPKKLDEHDKKLKKWKPGMKPLVQPDFGRWTSVYWRFGNVLQISFTEFWTEMEKKSASPLFSSLSDYTDWLAWDINQCFANVSPIKDTEEFKARFTARFVERLKKSGLLYIIVDPNEDISILQKRFDALLRQRRNKRLRSGPRLAEIETRLNVYELREKADLTYREIVAKVGSATDRTAAQEPATDAGWLNVRRTYERHYEKAAKMITLLEEGYFPDRHTRFF
jgi:hypothetical protein